MEWYKDFRYALDKEFKDQFVLVSSIPDHELVSGGRKIIIVYNTKIINGKDYFELKLVVSDGEYKNVINRIRKVVKDIGCFNGIAYDCVMSKEAYEKVSNFTQYEVERVVDKKAINNNYKKYFQKFYGHYLEEF